MKCTNFKWVIKSPFYVRFRKHYCPGCKVQLKVISESKIVYPDSWEAKEFDIGMVRGPHFIGPVKVIWKEFLCPQCERQFTIDEMKKIEGVN